MVACERTLPRPTGSKIKGLLFQSTNEGGHIILGNCSFLAVDDKGN